MAKNGVEGVYSADPRRSPNARFIEEITHRRGDRAAPGRDGLTALSLCMDNGAADPRLQHGRRAQHRPDSVRRECGDRCEKRMSDDPLKDFLDEAEGRHVEVRRGHPERVRHRAHRARVAAPARPRSRWTTTARSRRCKQLAQVSASEARLLTITPVRQELDQVDREGDPRVRRGPHAVERRQPDPPADPRADRGAPPGAGQGGARDRGAGQGRRPQRAPRGDARPARAQEARARSAPTTSTAPRPISRSSPTRASARSTRPLAGKEEEILEV